MKNIPTILKQLAERKARLAGELNTCKLVAHQLGIEVARLRLTLENKDVLLRASVAKKELLTKELEEIDKQIVDVNPRVNPRSIEPIKAWKGRYGKSGALKAFLLNTLNECSPHFLTTNELANSAIVEFSIVLESQKIRKKWFHHSLYGALWSMSKDGFVEKGPLQHSVTSVVVGTWRMKQESQQTLAELSAQSDAIAAAGH